MKIAVLSDVHGNLHALEAVYQDLKQESVDKVVFLGDLIMSGPRPNEVYDLMDYISPDIWIKGNTDDNFSLIEDFKPETEYERVLKSMRLWALDLFPESKQKRLLGLPIVQEFHYNKVKIDFCHGTPKTHSKAIMPEKGIEFFSSELSDLTSHAVICGHSHLRFSMLWSNILFKNFGSLSLPNRDQSKLARYGIINIDDTISFYDKDIEYNFDAYIKDMKSLNFPGIPNIFPKYGISNN